MSVGYQDRLVGEGNPNHKGAGWRICPVCNQEFHSYNKKAVYCSVPCRAKSKRRPEGFKRIRAISEHKKKYGKYMQKPLPLSFRAQTKHECQACGKVFYSIQKKRRTCSVECGRILSVEKQSRKVVVLCAVCGEPFEVPPSVADRMQKTTCSRRCMKIKRSLYQQGDKSHRWLGGKTSKSMLIRTSARYAEWRKQVFERDDFTCQLCNERGGKLAAHHIKPFAKHEELRLQVENGITLCWPCHASIKGKEGQYENQFAAKTSL